MAHPYCLRITASALVVALSLAACGGDDASVDGVSATTTTAPTATTTGPAGSDDPWPEVEPGLAIVTAGDERFEFVVFECRIGDETGSPQRRLALSGSLTEPFLEADVVLNVDLLVSRFGPEEHVITITRFDGTDLGAADLATPSRGGPAPDDWIELDEDLRSVRGRGFQLAPTEVPGGDPMPPGVLVADCPEPG